MSSFLHGIGTVQFIDKSGELLDLKGLSIDSLEKTGVINWEHLSNLPTQLVGKILKAKKIFSEKDCKNEHELYFWKKTKAPYLYIMAELLDDYCDSAKHVAGMLRYDRDRKGQNSHNIMWFSIEGSEIPNTRVGKSVITRGIARKVTLTSTPCNAAAAVEILENQAPKIKDDFDEIFKSDQEAVTLFKTGEGEKLYETFLAKKESEPTIKKKESKLCKLHKAQLEKGDAPKWSGPKVTGDAVHFSHPEHNIVSIHKQPSGEFHVKHNGRVAGIGGKKGVFGTAKEAGEHAQKLMSGLSSGTVSSPSMQNHPSPSIIGNTSLRKAVEAGSYNAAPSTLTNGAAYQTESMSTAKSSSEDHNFKGSKKKDWNAQAKSDYQNWPHKEKFEKFMKSKMPHLSKGEIEAFGRVLALKKNIELEESLSELVGMKKALTFGSAEDQAKMAAANEERKKNPPPKATPSKKSPELKETIHSEVSHTVPYGDNHETVHLKSGHELGGHPKGKFKSGDKVSAQPHLMGTHILSHRK